MERGAGPLVAGAKLIQCIGLLYLRQDSILVAPLPGGWDFEIFNVMRGVGTPTFLDGLGEGDTHVFC